MLNALSVLGDPGKVSCQTPANLLCSVPIFKICTTDIYDHEIDGICGILCDHCDAAIHIFRFQLSIQMPLYTLGDNSGTATTKWDSCDYSLAQLIFYVKLSRKIH